MVFTLIVSLLFIDTCALKLSFLPDISDSLRRKEKEAVAVGGTANTAAPGNPSMDIDISINFCTSICKTKQRKNIVV